MKPIKEYVRECHEVAVSKGWWDKTRTLDEIICLWHSEVSEILEEHRKNKKLDEIYYIYSDGYEDYELTEEEYQIQVNEGSLQAIGIIPKPEGIPIEFADLLIRVFDWIGAEDIQLEGTCEFKHLEDLISYLAELHFRISTFYFQYNNSMDDTKPYYMITNLIAQICYACEYLNIPIERALELKIEYNKTREYRHGGKKC